MLDVVFWKRSGKGGWGERGMGLRRQLLRGRSAIFFSQRMRRVIIMKII